jgi:hypothetical protein
MVGRSMISAVVLAAWVTTGLAQDAPSEVIAYCSDLKRVTMLALAGNQFASITGKSREGNFRDTTLPLTDWNNCALYGATTYTCDSQELKTSQDAEDALSKTTDQILRCLAGAWVEIKDRSSPVYAVLHPTRGAASITLSIDENDKKEFIVGLTLFLRRS